MADNIFSIDIPNLAGLTAAFKQAPEIVATELAKAFLSVKIALADNTKSNTPYRTGFLGNPANWGFTQEPLQASWFPTAKYAAAVEFGMPASPGRYVPAIGKRLIDASRPGFGMWPGFKGNDYMGRIADAATPRITDVFVQALQNITEQIAE